MSTIRCYLCSSNATHSHCGRATKPFEEVAKTGHGAERNPEDVSSQEGYEASYHPIDPQALRQRLAKSPGVDSKMMWAALCIDFFGFMWMGEFIVFNPEQASQVLKVDDVTVDSWENSRLVNLCLRSSKTDPYRGGVTVCLARNDADLCPMAASWPTLQ